MSDDFYSKLEKIALDSSISAAIASYKWIGRGDPNAADQAAVSAMREVLVKQTHISGKIAIGEGERDEAPMLYIGEILGSGLEQCDIAVDPLEGTTLCANGMPNSMTAIAIGKAGSLLQAPDLYMEKIASVKGVISDIDINLPIENNIFYTSLVLDKAVSEVNVLVLDRPRHAQMIAKIREYGARVILISDGDIGGVINASMNNDVDLYVGSGGAPEGVLAACALKVIGGAFQTKLICDTIQTQERAQKMGIFDFNKVYTIDDMIKGDIVFAMTGVTHGDLVSGVEYDDSEDLYTTHTLLFNSFNKTKKEIWTSQM